MISLTRSPAWLLITLLWVNSSPFARAEDPTDLDTLLQQVSLDVFTPVERVGMRPSQRWLQEVARLETSRDPVVAKAAKNLVPARDELAKIPVFREEMKRSAQEFQKRFANRPNVGAAVHDAIFGPSEEQLQALYRRGEISEQERDEFLARRRKVQTQAILDIAMPLGNSLALSKAVDFFEWHRRKRAEVLQAEVVHKDLLAVIEKRAGKAEVPIEGSYGMVQNAFWFVLVNRGKQDLHRVTLLIQTDVAVGRRRAVAYLPVWPAGQRIHLQPIVLSTLFLNDVPKQGGPKLDPFTSVSVWCDEGSSTKVKLTTLKSADIKSELFQHAVEPGASFYGPLSQRDSQAIRDARARDLFKNPKADLTPEVDRAPKLTFRKFSLVKDGFAVELDVYGPELPDKPRPKPVRCSGTILMGDAMKAFKNAPITIPLQHGIGTVGNRTGKLVLVLHADDDLLLHWSVYDGSNTTSYRPRSGTQQKDPANQMMEDAIALARQGHKPEAKALLERVIRDSAGTPREKSARETLDRIDQIPAQEGSRPTTPAEEKEAQELLLAAIKLVRTKPAEARTLLEKVIKTAPDSPSAVKARTILLQLRK